MKRNFFHLLRNFAILTLGFALTVNFVSCGDDEGDDKPADKGGDKIKAVDLGLSIKWGDRNIGANAPEVFGDFYAWGETETRDDYSVWNYKFNASEYYISMTKYCCSYEFGDVLDNKTSLDPEDDVAQVKLGKGWRMPTFAEIEELYNECTWENVTLNGVACIKLTGPNGNSIHLPKTGYIDAHSNKAYYEEAGERGFYWCSDLEPERNIVYCIYVSHDFGYCPMGRAYGLHVRPVKE